MVFVLVYNTFQKTQVFSNTRTCPKSHLQWPPSFTLNIWTTATPFWLSNPFPSTMAKADIQCIFNRSNNRPPWSVYLKLNLVQAVMTFPYLHMWRFFHHFPFWLQIFQQTKVYVPQSQGKYCLPALIQIMSLGARPPLYLSSYPCLGKTDQILWTSSEVCWWGNTLEAIHFINYTELLHKHCTCAFGSRLKASSVIHHE